jgi:hypothetical protein
VAKDEATEGSRHRSSENPRSIQGRKSTFPELSPSPGIEDEETGKNAMLRARDRLVKDTLVREDIDYD